MNKSELSDVDLVGQLIYHAHTFGEFVQETDDYKSELLQRLNDLRCEVNMCKANKKKEN